MSDQGGDDYEVGYGKPPKHTRFKQGQSGNPKGRPKGTRNFETDVKATLDAPVLIKRDGKPQKVSTQEAALLRLRERALAGDARALDRLLALAQIYNKEELTVHSQMSSDDASLLELFMQRVHNGVVSERPTSETGSDAAVDDPRDDTSKSHRRKEE